MSVTVAEEMHQQAGDEDQIGSSRQDVTSMRPKQMNADELRARG
jgi:hypothetical protein